MIYLQSTKIKGWISDYNSLLFSRDSVSTFSSSVLAWLLKAEIKNIEKIFFYNCENYQSSFSIEDRVAAQDQVYTQDFRTTSGCRTNSGC